MRETTATVRADIRQHGVNALRAESTFISANASVGRVGWQVFIAAFTIWTDLKHDGPLLFSLADARQLAKTVIVRNDQDPAFYAMPRNIEMFIFPGFQLLDATGPLAAFEVANEIVPGTYKLSVVASERGAIRSSCGISIVAAALRKSTVDTFLVSGGNGRRTVAASPKTLAAIKRSNLYARRTASVCTGAFILAAAGLLKGKRATTHWANADEFRRAFPDIRLVPDQIFVRDGTVWTSAGITAGIDLALALIADDLGKAVAQRAAQELVVYWRRPAGQSQFSALATIDSGGRFSGLLGWARGHLGQPLTVERLAQQAAMSPRHFARAFARETGLTPAKAIERLRLELARQRIETSTEQLAQIAIEAGFQDADRMRRAFVRAVGQPPQVLRRLAKRGHQSR